MSDEKSWYRIDNEESVYSPSLLVYPGRIESNIRKMLEIAGGAGLLRPHVKTHKMAEVIKLQTKYGINKFKCATIAECEMVATCGAPDILLAIQPVGPNIERFLRLGDTFKNVTFSCIADSAGTIQQLSEKSVHHNRRTGIWLDINAGMNRTGILPGKEAIRLYEMINTLPGIYNCGLHVYDGHIRDRDPEARKDSCSKAFVPVGKMIMELRNLGFDSVRIVAGGSPTFPIHASMENAETSPGTVLLWDYGYSSSLSDLEFLHAAVLFTRVISKPADNLICLDLGHKAVGSEMPQPRIKILDFDDYTIEGHSEEHMVIRSAHAAKLNTGDAVYAIPWHICPTVDRHDAVYVVQGHKVTEQWKVDARKRQITM